MSQYWIRNRGRTTGPFTADKLHSLARRGRFNKHFQVSRDRKDWRRATEFPELFAPVHEVVPTPQYGEPGGYADDLVEPPRSAEPSRKSRARDDEPDDDDEIRMPKKKKKKVRSVSDDDWDDDDEDDDEWDDDDDYESAGLGEWLNDHVFEILVVVALGLIGTFAWYILMRESFTQDEEDLAVVVAFRDEIRTAHATGKAGTPDWENLRARADSEFAAMITRLESTASAQDNIKQELLFATRDDFPAAMQELPTGEEKAAQRIDIRIQKVREMIGAKSRRYTGSTTVPSGSGPGSNPDAIAKLRQAAGLEPATNPPGDGNSGEAATAGENAGGIAGGVRPGNNPGSGQANQPPQQPQAPPQTVPPNKAVGEGGGAGMRPALGGGSAATATPGGGEGGYQAGQRDRSEGNQFNRPGSR